MRFDGADFSATTLRGRPRGRLALAASDFFALGLGGRPRRPGFLAADLAGFFEGPEVFDFLGKAIFGEAMNEIAGSALAAPLTP